MNNNNSQYKKKKKQLFHPNFGKASRKFRL